MIVYQALSFMIKRTSESPKGKGTLKKIKVFCRHVPTPLDECMYYDLQTYINNNKKVLKYPLEKLLTVSAAPHSEFLTSF